MATATRRLKHWGWGYEDQQPDRGALEATAKAIHERLGFEVDEIEEPVPLDRVELPEPRLKAPKRFAEMFSAEPYDRIGHALGKAYRDVVRGFRGEFPNPPDLVAYPESAEDVDLALSFADEARAAAIPFGGGTSVVGGVEPRIEGDYEGVDQHRPAAHGPGARGRRGLAGRANPGRRNRAGAGGPAAGARADAAPLPPVLRVRRRSAAGSRPGREGTSRRSTRTSTTWSSRCGR